jgi:gas vesicle protein
MRRLLSFFAGAIMGGLVGATVAVLLAPASGEDLRTQLRERSIRLQDEIRSAANDRRAELERELTALRSPRKKSQE